MGKEEKTISQSRISFFAIHDILFVASETISAALAASLQTVFQI